VNAGQFGLKAWANKQLLRGWMRHKTREQGRVGATLVPRGRSSGVRSRLLTSTTVRRETTVQ
jgi:hypothetical protein